VLDAGLLGGASALLAQRAQRLGLVDHEASVVAAGQLGDALQGRALARGEQPVGHDQAAAPLCLEQPPLEVLDVPVVVDEGLGFGQPAAVQGGGVRARVHQHHLAGAGQGGHDAQQGEVARAHQQRGLVAVEVGQPLLEPAVDAHGAGHGPGGAGAGPVSHGRLGRGLAHARVVGQPQVVVRAQQQDRAAVEQHARTLGPGDQADPAYQPRILDLRDRIFHLAGHGRQARGRTGRVA
jgi:hypothetical protein